MAVDDLGTAGGHERGSLDDAQLARVVETAVNPFVVIDTLGTVTWAGASVAELLGVDAAALIGRSMLELLAPSSVDEALRALAAADEYVRSRRSNPDQWEGTGPLLDVVCADGSVMTCAVAVATPGRTGIDGYTVQLRRAQSAGALERTIEAMAGGATIDQVLRHLATVLAGDLPNTDVVVAHSARPGPPGAGYDHAASTINGPLVDVVRSPCDLAAPWVAATRAPERVHELTLDELPPSVREPAAEAGVRSCASVAVSVDPQESPSAVIVAWRRHDLPLHVFSMGRMQRAAKLVGLALQWERGRRALQWAATHDSLTGLHNRQAFLAQLAQAARPGRAPSGTTTTVLYLDLDDFKPVNDQHGHALGDRVLAEIAARIRHAVRPTDLVARLGGDEFAILCIGLDDPEVAEQLAARLVDEVARPVRVDGTEVQVGLSVGIAGLVDAEGTPEEIMNRADGALRQAKAAGKRRWQRAT